MKQATYENILAYGKKLKETYPDISNEDLKKALLTYFVGGKDILKFSNLGAIARLPLLDYIAILTILYNSLRKIITQDKTKLNDIQEDINRAIDYLLSVQ